VYFGHLHVQISATNPLPSTHDSLFDASYIELHQDRSISVWLDIWTTLWSKYIV